MTDKDCVVFVQRFFQLVFLFRLILAYSFIAYEDGNNEHGYFIILLLLLVLLLLFLLFSSNQIGSSIGVGHTNIVFPHVHDHTSAQR